MRRYDVADRRRRLIDLLAVFNFTPDFSIDYTGSYKNDDYPSSRYGLVDDSSRHHVLGVNFAPFSPCTVRMELANDFATRRLNARLRELLFGQPADSAVNDWSDEISEKGHTISAEAQCLPEDEKWDLAFGLVQIGDRQTDDAAFAPHAFIDPGFAGHARRYPPTHRTFRETHARARFRLTRVFDLVLKATFEEFVEGDPTQDVMSPPMGRYDPRAFESAYLGVRVDSYSTAIFDVFLGAHW